MRHAKKLYVTPDDWGDTNYYAPEYKMKRFIAEMRKNGADWSAISLADCDTVDFVRVHPDGVIYESIHSYTSGGKWHHTTENKLIDYSGEHIATFDPDDMESPTWVRYGVTLS